MRTIDVILENAPGAVLDSERIDNAAFQAAGGDTSAAIHRVIARWVLSPGDTIRIVEVE